MLNYLLLFAIQCLPKSQDAANHEAVDHFYYLLTNQLH